MAVDRELRRLLARALLPEPHESAREVLAKLRRAARQRDVGLAELLALAAEAASHQRDFGAAQDAVDWFLRDCRAKNQFYCRVQLVRAQCASHAAASAAATGASRLRRVLDALHFVLLVLPVATDARRRPHYDFLVYNASVVYWRIARQLMKRATWQFLVPSLSRVLDALRAVGERDGLWLARLQLALVSALLDAKQFAEAARAVNELVDGHLAPLVAASQSEGGSVSEELTALVNAALRAQVHVGSMKDAECQKIVANVRKSAIVAASKHAALLVKLQCVRSGGSLSGAAADATYSELFQDATGFSAFSAAATSDEELTRFLDALDAKAVEAIDADVVAETGLHAASAHELRAASACDRALQRKGKSLAPRQRVLHQVLRAVLLVATPPATHSWADSRAKREVLVLARRAEAVKALERAILAAKRQADPDLVESVCVHAWNLSLPLLQPHLRGQLGRVLALATDALEAMDSLLLELRARLLLEMAKLEVASDFLIKAFASVSKALALDYGASVAQAKTLDDVREHESRLTTRPVDVHLLQLRKTLQWRLDMEEPGDGSGACEGPVRVLVEQARETKDSAALRAALTRASALLVELTEQRAAPERLVVLWLDVCKLLRDKLQDVAAAEHFAKRGLELFFSTGASALATTPTAVYEHSPESAMRTEKSLVALEIEFRALVVEILAARLKTRAEQIEAAKKRPLEGMRRRDAARHQSALDDLELAALKLLPGECVILGIQQPHKSELATGDEADAETIRTRAKAIDGELDELKRQLLGHLVASLTVAGHLGWRFALENTCVRLWNYHFHVFRMLASPSFSGDSVLRECVAAFEAAYTALEVFPGVDGELLACTALGLAKVYERMAQWDRALAIADSFLKRKGGAGSSAVSAVHRMRFAELKTRAQLAQNAKEVALNEPASAFLRVAAYLEALESTSTQQQSLSTAAQSYFQRAVALWPSVAAEMVAPVLSGSPDAAPPLTMEDAQQQVEIYTELWTRVAHAALRLQQFRFAVECSSQARVVLTSSSSSETSGRHQAPPLTIGTWRWLAASEILCGRAILALGSGESPPKKLVLAALVHLANAVEYGDRANAGSLVVKAGEVVWNAALMAFNSTQPSAGNEYDSADVKRVIELLRVVLVRLGKVVVEASEPAGEAPSCFGDLVLLTLAVCENAGEWSESCGICEDALASRAMASVPARTLNEIRTAAAISAAKLGKALVGGSASSGSGRRKADEQSPILRAKILKKIAFSSAKDPPAQLKALASAHAELAGKPEEQAVVLLDMAEWFYASRISAQDTESHLDRATKILLASETRAHEPLPLSPSRVLLHSRSGLATSGNRLKISVSASALKQDPDAPTYSALWLNEKLIRVFVMKAMTAASFVDRCNHVEEALSCVQRAWEGIVATVNVADLQERFAKAPGSSELDFDEWSSAEEPRHVVPQSSLEWVAFYSKSVDGRFSTEWVEKLQAAHTSAPATLHFTDPIVTGYYLEQLLAMLREHRLDELALPTICLYQVIFHGYVPRQAHTMRLWLELTLFDVLERTDLAACALPMQSALEIFQEHGRAIIDELRSHASGSAAHIRNGVCRRVLSSTSPDLLEKMRSCVRMFVRFGYVRQGKSGLEILRRIAEQPASTPANESELRVLAALVLDMEGSGGAAAAEIATALREPPTLSLRELVQWTLQYCELTPTPADCVARLQTTEQLAAKWLVPHAASDGGSSSLQGGTGELQLSLWLAKLKFTRAIRLLNGAGDAEWRSGESDAIASSRQALSKSEQVLSHIDAKPVLSQYLVRYANALLSRSDLTSAAASASDVAFATAKLDQALVELAAVRSRVRQISAWRVLQSSENEDVAASCAALTTPLDRDFLLAKSLRAAVELAAETSSAAVTEHEMTFYAHEADSRRNIVEKWLCETSPGVKAAVGGDLGLVLVLSTPERANPSASAFDGSDESLAVAAMQSLQCQRLARSHSEDKARSRKVRDKLWTRFTSAKSAHATWICGANASDSSAAASAVPDSTLTDAEDEAAAAAAAKLREENDELDAFLSDYARQMLSLQKFALEKRDFALLRGCALELVQVTGCNRPLECIRSLLLYQSVVVRGYLQEIFERCVAPRDAQQLHLRRLEKLQQVHANAARHSAPHQLSLLFLEQQSAAFKRMSVAVPPETILASLPPLARVLSLQLSPDMCFLFCAVVGSGEKQYALARMECTASMLAHLSQIRERVQRWRAASAQLLAELEELHSQEPDFEFVVVDSVATLGLSSSHDELEREFSAIIVDMAEFFAPLLSHSALHAVLQSELPGATLTLLLDRDLECLPLEALPALEKAESVARDLSLHVLFQRLQAQRTQPFKRDDMRFIVDPHQEDPGLEAQTMEAVLQQHVKRPGAAFATWREAVEHGQPPTSTDWQHALLNRRGGGLFYLGANRVLGSSVSPSDLLAMSPALSCHVVCLLDRAENTASARRQSKVDSEKPAWQLALEGDAYANAMLWSLAGVNVLVQNQWAATFNANRRLASALLGGLSRGFSVGKALKKYGEQVAPSGVVAATAPPSAASSAVSSASSLPPASSSSSATTLPVAEPAGSSTAKLHRTSIKPVSSEAGAKSGGGSKLRLKHRVRFDTVVYGLAHVALKSAD